MIRDSFGLGDQDGLLLSLTDEGRVRWMRFYGDSDDDRAFHSTPMPDRGYASVGYSRRQGTLHRAVPVPRIPW